VFESGVREGCSGLFDMPQLLRLKVKAVRSGVWFRALRRIDRVLVDLTIRVGVKVKSDKLARSLLSVVRKLEGFLESKFACVVREFGFASAYKLSVLAQNWGYSGARKWAKDSGFARYLAMMRLNSRTVT